MKPRRIIILLFCILVNACYTARADEGMWLIQSLDKTLCRNMKARGLKLGAKEIFNADDPGESLAGTIVSLDFIGTGSVISHDGLVITNHHCAYDDIHSLSTPQKNYLEDGFWAESMEEEIPIPEKRMLLLKKIIDVTDEVNAVFDSTGARGRLMGFRKVTSIMEERYSAPGEEAYLNSMWSGTKYYISIYKVYKDIRLVAAPPVSIAAFGGDTDNWEWPQHKCDFAIYRIYDNGKPLYCPRKLDIAAKGVKQGDYTMVIGFPGRTNRYNSSYKTEFERDITLPIESQVRGETMEILRKWMNYDPEVRLKYSDKFFNLSNGQELYLGEVMCYHRFGVVDERREEEEKLLRGEHSELLDHLMESYQAMREPQTSLEYYREALIRGCGIYAVQTRVKTIAKSRSSQLENIQSAIAHIYQGMDLRVERDLFIHAVSVFYNNVDRSFWGDYQKELYAKYEGAVEEIAADLWDSSWLTNESEISRFLSCTDASAFFDDPIINFYSDAEYPRFSDAVSSTQKYGRVSTLGSDYTKALYEARSAKGIAQYPDANSSMRLTYGTIGGFYPRDGVYYNWKSCAAGVLEKHDPNNYDFALKSDWKAILEAAPSTMCVDFITDNDITGGNSGSPVLNARGEVVGLAFDGNKESLAGDVSFTPGYNKCVCTDIRYVIFTLENYMGMGWLLDEIKKK